MEQGKEATGKRSWFAPIVLLLLVVSVTMNMYLYSQKLYGMQDVNVKDGKAIIRYVEEAAQHTEQMAAMLREYAAAEALEPLDGYHAGVLLHSASVLEQLMLAAQERGAAGAEAAASAFNAYAHASLAAAFGADEAPTAGQRVGQLDELASSYEQLHGILQRFDLGEATTQNALYAHSGSEWRGLADELAAALADAVR